MSISRCLLLIATFLLKDDTADGITVWGSGWEVSLSSSVSMTGCTLVKNLARSDDTWYTYSFLVPPSSFPSHPVLSFFFIKINNYHLRFILNVESFLAALNTHLKEQALTEKHRIPHFHSYFFFKFQWWKL